jgi:ABC-type branched-subunit amino acid transport system ATPase component
VTILLVGAGASAALKRLQGDTVAVMNNGRVVHAGSITAFGCGQRGVAAFAAGAGLMRWPTPYDLRSSTTS